MAGSLKFINLLQGLTLAIDQAGSRMRETGTDALQYMKLYEEIWGKLMIQQHQFAVHEATAHSILITWTASFNDLQMKCPDAANLLVLCAFLDNQDIWHELFTPALDSKISTNYLIDIPDVLTASLGLINVLHFLYGTIL